MIDFTIFWRQLISQSIVSFQTKGKAFKFIDIARDCITLYGGLKVTLPTISFNISVDSADILGAYPFYKDDKVPPVSDITNQKKHSNLIECHGKPVFLRFNGIHPLNRRHSFWHDNSERKTLTHHHYASVSNQDLTPNQIKCLLEKVQYFNKFSPDNELISSEEIKDIITLYQKENQKFTTRLSQLAAATSASFIRMAVMSFCLDFFGRYLLPLFLYNTDLMSFNNKKALINLARYSMPAFKLITTLLNNQFIAVPTALDTLALILSSFNFKFTPELASVINILFTISQGEFTDQVAAEIGKDFGIIIGGASAKALGTVLSNMCIKLLPKLRTEPEIPPTETANVMQSTKNQPASLRHRLSS